MRLMTSSEKPLSFNSLCSGKGAEDDIVPTTHCDPNTVVVGECPLSGISNGAQDVDATDGVTYPIRRLSPVLLEAYYTFSDPQSDEEDVTLGSTEEMHTVRRLAKNILARFELLLARLDMDIPLFEAHASATCLAGASHYWRPLIPATNRPAEM